MVGGENVDIAGSGNGGYNGEIIGALNQTLTSKSGAEINGPFNTVPEPSTMLLLATGLFGLATQRRSRRPSRQL